ncbi:MAG: B12-binding domain-containing radical SAM protein [Candidatus Margulisbacteria bacterium]|nr:B12-binding domain-containing radical SAM protein [Candidatus Margulisiibacteriota bacterium]MBU1021084.1 B12-binding domain-containing radical SAM protein [Candidatus Margulisiibacteriota bacterium]MBU1729893.1 B12-binding domain-containing radical SAM protein [Candidatus Margulisiibacteriota bacterium]MBU1955223.1 B12-binding domain-containing radical SAM protein [Candidatus Margulisiibacteriota bacterium]
MNNDPDKNLTVKKNRIALVQPPDSDVDFYVPFGLLCLAQYLKQFSFDPIIVDLNLHFKSGKLASNFFKSAARKILNSRPSVIGFTVVCSTLPETLLIAKECKKIEPALPIILGGPDVSFEGVELLNTFKFIDIIVRGEGELTFTEVLSNFSKGEPLSNVAGITYRQKGKVIQNPDRPFIEDLDSLPPLDFSILPHLDKYKIGQIEAGRGCPNQCTFCSTCKMWRKTFRIKSPQRLAREIMLVDSLFNKTEDSCINVIHDHFLTSRETADEFLSLIAHKNIAWACSSRLEALDEPLIKKLKKAGCRGMLIGVESASPQIQRQIKKNLPLSMLPKVVKLLSQHEIQSTLSFIIGFPNEKASQIDKTLNMALSAKLYGFLANVWIRPATFLKGSEMFNKVKDDFKNVEFWHSAISPMLTGLSEEFDLIKKYPRIFPSFYSLKRKDFQPIFLARTCLLFSFLIEFFPITTSLLLKSFSMSPLALDRRLISFFNSLEIEWKVKKPGKSLFCYYLPFFKKFVKHYAADLIKEVFAYEELFHRTDFFVDPGLSNRNKIHLTSRPKITRGVQIKTYNYNVSSIIKNLRSGIAIKVKRVQSFMAVVPGVTAESFALTPHLYRILSLCNGRRTAGEIISNILGVENDKLSRKALLKLLKVLQKQNIIYIPKIFSKKPKGK